MMNKKTKDYKIVWNLFAYSCILTLSMVRLTGEPKAYMITTILLVYVVVVSFSYRTSQEERWFPLDDVEHGNLICHEENPYPYNCRGTCEMNEFDGGSCHNDLCYCFITNDENIRRI
ncbi:uncharacterized protein LOC144349233 [Saccoglossus kowalevskii]